MLRILAPYAAFRSAFSMSGPPRFQHSWTRGIPKTHQIHKAVFDHLLPIGKFGSEAQTTADVTLAWTMAYYADASTPGRCDGLDRNTAWVAVVARASGLAAVGVRVDFSLFV
jgi:hypothetical protein